MMVLLSKAEYDELVAKASNAESLIQEREEKARKEILHKLHDGMVKNRGYYDPDPGRALAQLIGELLR